MKIYAYYQSLPFNGQAEEFAKANLWKASWEKHGWTPIMLNRSHADASTLKNKLAQSLSLMSSHMLSDFASEIPKLTARIYRWCAFHAAGGGWMCDYDVVNKGFTPEMARVQEQKNGTLQTNQDGRSFLFYANSEMTGMAIKRFNAESLVAFGHPVNEHLILGSTDVMNGIDGLIFHASGDEKLAQMENAIAS